MSQGGMRSRRWKMRITRTVEKEGTKEKEEED